MMRTIGALVLGLVFAIAGCGSNPSKMKGSAATTPGAAKSMNQKTGSKAKGTTSQATNMGTADDSIPCDSSIDGVGFCSSDAVITFCDSGTWWQLDCSAVDPASYCGTDDSDSTVDCYI